MATIEEKIEVKQIEEKTKAEESSRMLAKKKYLLWAGFGLALILIFAAHGRHDRQAALDILPKNLNIVDVLLFKTIAKWGPGDEGSIVAIYKMPENMSVEIMGRGALYLDEILADVGQYRWAETPVNDSMKDLCGVACYELPEKKIRLIDQIVNNKNSYYVKYEGGFLVASPKEKVVLYLYSD